MATCNVCGAEANSEMDIVPFDFLEELPEVVKTACSDNTVQLCETCNEFWCIDSEVIRKKFAFEDAVINPVTYDARFVLDEDVLEDRWRARKIRELEGLSEGNRKEYERLLLKRYPNNEVVDDKLLDEACELQVVFESYFEDIATKVVEKYKSTDEGVLLIVKKWVLGFYNSMKPRYMPLTWAIDGAELRLKDSLREGRITEEELKNAGVKLD